MRALTIEAISARASLNGDSPPMNPGLITEGRGWHRELRSNHCSQR